LSACHVPNFLVDLGVKKFFHFQAWQQLFLAEVKELID
jgi:hypothetical protein